MRPGDTTIGIAQKTTVTPLLSLYHSATYHNGRKPASLEAFTPIGEIKMLGGTGPEIAAAKVPIAFFPITTTELLQQPIWAEVKKSFTVKASARHPKRPQYTVRPQLGPLEMAVYPDASKLYCLTLMDTILDTVSHINSTVIRADIPEYDWAPLGLGIFETSNGAPKLKTEPPMHIDFSEGSVRLDVEVLPMTHSQAKGFIRWIILLAAALKNVHEVFDEIAFRTRNTKEAPIPEHSLLGLDGKPVSDKFYYALANFLLASYGSTNQTAPAELWYGASDTYETVTQFMGLPWSMTYPYLQPVPDPDILYKTEDAGDKNLQDIADMVKSICLLNMCLALAVKRVGLQIVDATYWKTKGSHFSIREQFERTLKPAFDGGGSFPFWMPVGNNRPMDRVIYLPWMIDPKTRATYRENVRMPEKFETTVIDRGEEVQVTAYSKDVHKFLQISRDARVGITEIEEMGNSYFEIRIPMTHHGNRELGAGVLMSYFTDGMDHPGPMLKADHRVFMSAEWDMVTGKHGVLYTDSGAVMTIKTRSDSISTGVNGKTKTDTVMTSPGLTSPGKDKDAITFKEKAEKATESPTISETTVKYPGTSREKTVVQKVLDRVKDTSGEVNEPSFARADKDTVTEHTG